MNNIQNKQIQVYRARYNIMGHIWASLMHGYVGVTAASPTPKIQVGDRIYLLASSGSYAPYTVLCGDGIVTHTVQDCLNDPTTPPVSTLWTSSTPSHGTYKDIFKVKWLLKGILPLNDLSVLYTPGISISKKVFSMGTKGVCEINLSNHGSNGSNGDNITKIQNIWIQKGHIL